MKSENKILHRKKQGKRKNDKNISVFKREKMVK